MIMIWSVHVLNMYVINANSILGNKIAYFREKYRIQHDFLNLNKAIKMN